MPQAYFDPDAALATYRDRLERYRDTLDLLSPIGFAQLERHLLEAERYAALIARHSPGPGVVLDVGSGAGLPGVVVAARSAPRPVWLVERRRKRATFLRGVVAAAGLGAASVFDDDVRDLQRPAYGVAVVTAQAVAPLVDIAVWTVHLWGPTVLLVSRKGPEWRDELAALEEWWRRLGPGKALGPGGWAVGGPKVVAAEPLDARGTLVAVEMVGG